MQMNKFERYKIDPDKSELDIWSMFSSILKYTQFNNLQTLTCKPKLTTIFAKLDNDKSILKDIDYNRHFDKVKEDNQDVYEWIRSELVYVG